MEKKTIEHYYFFGNKWFDRRNKVIIIKKILYNDKNYGTSLN